MDKRDLLSNVAYEIVMQVRTGKIKSKEENIIAAISEKVQELCLSVKDSIVLSNCVFGCIGGNARVALFEEVSEKIKEEEDIAGKVIKLPDRATTGSAGYDFYSPISFKLGTGESIVVPTGVRCCMDSRYVMKIYPRSGLGFKYFVGLANTVGIIDSDYYYSDNEGHIKIKLVNDGKEELVIKEGEAIAQGVFVEYGVTINDVANGVRNGGFNSSKR